MTFFNHKIETYKDLKDFITFMNERKCPDDTKTYFQQVNMVEGTISEEALEVNISVLTDNSKPMSLLFKKSEF